MVCESSLFPISAALELEGPLLPEASPRDWRWSLYKRRSFEIARMLHTAHEYWKDEDACKWAYRIEKCASWMKFRSTIDGLKLVQSNFCRCRVCPVCTARKTDIWPAKALQGLPRIEKAFPADEYQFLFLTLTVQNCQIEDLRSTLNWMKVSFDKLTGNDGGQKNNIAKSWPGIGWLKSIEVTKNKLTDEAHPHIHCLILVEKSYFELGNYITQKKWVDNWQKCLGVDYKPLVSIMAVNRDEDELTNSLMEILKYEVKPSDFKGCWKWFTKYAHEVKGLRFISSNGVLRNYFRFTEGTTDLIHGADTDENDRLQLDTKSLIQFNWDTKQKYFVCTESLS